MSDVTTWDAHAHVIGDPRRFPFAAGRAYTPDPAPLDAYLAMLDRHDIARGVLVQPSAYGFDNGCLVDALDRAGGRLRGVAVPAPGATGRDLEALHAHGVRAIRCNLVNPGGLSPAVIAAWQPVLRALGWHVEFQIAVDLMPEWADVVVSFDVPVVIDHMGRPAPGQVDPRAPALARLIDLARNDRCLVKLSAPYRMSDAAEPWSDVVPLAHALLEANPSACLWGSDWPHVHTPHAVETDQVFTALAEWCPDPARRRSLTSVVADRLFSA